MAKLDPQDDDTLVSVARAGMLMMFAILALERPPIFQRACDITFGEDGAMRRT